MKRLIKHIFKNNRGVALLMTLSIVSILVVTTLELNKKIRTSVYWSATGRDRITMNHMALSGVQAAMALLVKDRENSDIDSIQEDWANPEKLSALMADIPFDVMLQTGIVIEAIPFWEDEWAYPERFGNPALIENIRREGIALGPRRSISPRRIALLASARLLLADDDVGSLQPSLQIRLMPQCRTCDARPDGRTLRRRFCLSCRPPPGSR